LNQTTEVNYNNVLVFCWLHIVHST